MINSKSINNGRIDIMGPIGPQFSFADKIPLKECASYNTALRGTWTDTPLSILFFSKENMELLQTSIKRGVYEKSNQQFLIGNQSCDELKIIMRSTFLQHSHNLSHDLKEQIKELNCLVLDYSIKQVYNSAVSYLKYKQAVSSAPIIPQHPVNSSSKGNSLEFKGFV